MKSLDSGKLKTMIETETIRLNRLKKDKRRLSKEIRKFIIAKKMINAAIKLAQERFQSKIDPIVQLAINSIYTDREYKFWHESKKRADGFDWIQKIKDGNIEIEEVKSDVGGGLREVIGFALKMAFKMINIKNTRNIVFLDEPFSGLGSLMPLAGELLKTLSKNGGPQIILVTHSDELASQADVAYHVDFDKKKKKSLVKRIK